MWELSAQNDAVSAQLIMCLEREQSAKQGWLTKVFNSERSSLGSGRTRLKSPI